MAARRIVDLFAGAGGWEEGLKELGYSALGIELDPAACTTARAAGHERLRADVAALDPEGFAPLWGLIGSPPCQAWSTAGKGLGRRDKPQVIACAHELAAGNDSRAERLAACRDPRSLLIVEPLRWALALRPRWVTLEQVPPALELWSHLCGLLAAHGYEATCGILGAERHGIPQSRRRAFLIASLDGPVSLPAPTHRSYDPRRPGVVREEERGLRPWVGMAEALGRVAAGAVVLTNNQTDSGRRPRGLRRPLGAPSRTVDGCSSSWTIERAGEGAGPVSSRAERIGVREASILQGFRPDYPWQGSRTAAMRQVGNAVCPPLAKLVLAAAMAPGEEARV